MLLLKVRSGAKRSGGLCTIKLSQKCDGQPSHPLCTKEVFLCSIVCGRLLVSLKLAVKRTKVSMIGVEGLGHP